jgi:hypothetical protein
LGTLIAQGDIGQNALTGENVEYVLNPVSDPEISGTVTFAERMNGMTLITIELTGTTDGGDHPAHIHNNSAAQGGGIAIDLKNVNGATGKSATSVVQMNNGTAITYTELIDFNGDRRWRQDRLRSNERRALQVDCRALRRQQHAARGGVAWSSIVANPRCAAVATCSRAPS